MRILVVSFTLLWLANTAASQESANLRYFKPVDRPPAREDEILSLPLDSDIFAATRDGLPDLRILDNANSEVPFLVEIPRDDRKSKFKEVFETKLVALKPEGNTLEIHLRLPDDSPFADGLVLATPLRNYERKVRVSGSEDGKEWKSVQVDGVVFDYSQYMDISNREIALPTNRFREFKVTISDVIDERESPLKALSKTFRDAKQEKRVEMTVIERRPFRIDRIGAWHDKPVQETRITPYAVKVLETAEDTTKKQTVITVQTRREPINRLILETPDTNFSRRVTVETLSTQGKAGPSGEIASKNREDSRSSAWRIVGEGTVENFQFRDQKRQTLFVNIPTTREKQFRLILHNEDNPPLTISGVQAEGDSRRAVFLARPGKTYRLYYGSATLELPNYEAGKVLGTLRKESAPIEAGLGKQVENSAFREAGRKPVSLLNNWIFLGTTLVIMVVLLGWILFRAGKRLESVPGD